VLPRTLSLMLLLLAGQAWMGGATLAATCKDADNDGYAVCSGGCTLGAGDLCGDCDDHRASVRPGVAEQCFNLRDDDCDGATDLQDPECLGACPDADGDGWAVCSGSCSAAPGDTCGDCDDGRADTHPNRNETCNARDDDCDGAKDEGNPGGGSACTTGEAGVCDAGVLTCTGGSLQCQRVREPSVEDCDNGLDDDCNGVSDGADAACSAACTGILRPDADGDAVPDCADNCPGVVNPLQGDFDDDGTGDACETGVRLCDIDHSGRVDGLDLAIIGRGFGQSCGQGGYDAGADLTRDCTVDGEDLALMAAEFGHN